MQPVDFSSVSPRRRTARRVALALSALLAPVAVSACSSDDERPVAVDDDVVAPTVGVVDEPVPDGTDLFTEAGPDGGVDGDGASTTVDPNDLGPVPPPLPTDVVSDSVLDPIEPVPDTGVPGIESGDDFCRSWSRYAGSYQALTFAWAVVGGVQAARFEVIAHDALRSAVDTLASSLPDELENERGALTVDLPTPLLRRAELASGLLAAEGLDDDDNAVLTEAWFDALTEYGVESEALVVVFDDPEIEAAVSAAADTLLAELPPITEDPSLIVDVDISATEDYLFENCPDKGILAGNDNVDG